MRLSVVVPTLNGREQLASCLDSIAEHAPDAEVVVVNGPSTDGTTGMVRERDDVDVLVEVSDRNLNVARNAGVVASEGDAVAFVRHDLVLESGWGAAVREALEGGADVVSGPTHRTLRGGVTTEDVESRVIAGRYVTYFNGDNVALTRETVEAIDGFDETLATGAARDAAHRLAAVDRYVTWRDDICVRGEYGADGGRRERDWGERYRSLTYRLVKNYGVRPTVVRRVAGHAISDAIDAAKDVAAGDATPTAWFGNGRAVVGGIAGGAKDGFLARRNSGESRNPAGLSARHDRAVERYDWR